MRRPPARFSLMELQSDVLLGAGFQADLREHAKCAHSQPRLRYELDRHNREVDFVTDFVSRMGQQK